MQKTVKSREGLKACAKAHEQGKADYEETASIVKDRLEKFKKHIETT